MPVLIRFGPTLLTTRVLLVVICKGSLADLAGWCWTISFINPLAASGRIPGDADGEINRSTALGLMLNVAKNVATVRSGSE